MSPRAWLVLRVLFAVGLLAFVFSRVDPGAAVDEVARAPAWAFAVPAVLLAGNSLLHAIRLRLLAPEPAPGIGTMFRIALLGNFFGLFLPTGGGEAAKVVALSRHVGGIERGLGVLGTVRVMELLPWTIFVLWGAVRVLPGRLPDMLPLAWAAAAAFVVVLAAAALVLSRGEAVAERFPAALSSRLRRLAAVRAPPARMLACLLLAFPFGLVNCLVVWAILRAYGHPIDYGTVVGLVPTLDILISLPITISGVGVREGLFVHAFSAWGVPEAVALAVAFTRWTGELGRSALGGVLFALSRGGAR